MNFASDNTSGVCPEVMAAITAEADRSDAAYGGDEMSQELLEAMAQVFERPVEVYCVVTGTAANALALAATNPVWGGVACHEKAHIVADECAAPTVIGSGLSLQSVGGAEAKLTPEVMTDFLGDRRDTGVHAVPITALSMTQATELGTRYSPEETAALCDLAHAHDMAVHLDGARFANAVAAAAATPAELTWRAGVDIMSFGATKGGAMAAETVVVFSDCLRDDIGRLRKRTGHLLSKQRFAAAQFVAWLRDGAWLAHADHANVSARRLGEGLRSCGIELAQRVEANMVFALFDPTRLDAARAAGAEFYLESPRPLPDGRVEARFVTSWSSSADEVDRLVDAVAASGER